MFHCIGFARNHDVRVLNALANCGSSPGTFQYAEASDKLQNCVEQLVDVLSARVFSCTIFKRSNATAQRIHFSGDGIARTFLGPEDISTGTIKASIKDTYVTFDLQEMTEDTHLQSIVELFIHDIQTKLESSADTVFVKNPSMEALTTCTERIAEMEMHIQQTVKKAYRVKKGEREPLVTRCMELTALVDALRARIALAVTGSLKDSQIAEWRDLASRPRLSNRRANKELDKRAITNSNILDESLSAIKTMVQTMDLDNASVPADVQENCVCVYTLNRPVDALREGDCMALTLQVRRSEAAIFDPNQLVVDAIGVSFLTCDTFFETSALAKRYSEADTVDPSAISLKSPERASSETITTASKTVAPQSSTAASWSGGFDKSTAGSLIKGVGAENINGILPLYLFEEHWKVAKIKMKPVLGYMCTLDVTGYTASQVTIVPFLVMYKALQNLMERADDHNKFIHRIVLETCRAIYEPRKALREDVKKLYADYIQNPARRVADVVPRTCTFLMHLYLALLVGDIPGELVKQQFSDFRNAIAEETLRRAVRNMEALPDSIALYGIDEARDISTPVDEYDRKMHQMKQDTGVSNASIKFRMLADALSGKTKLPAQTDLASDMVALSVTPKEEPGVGLSPHQHDAMTASWNPCSIKFVNRVIANVNVQLLPVLRVLEHITGITTTENPFETMSHMSRLAAVVQCFEQRKQADRLDAVEKGKWIDFFREGADGAARAFLNVRADKAIANARQAVINQILSVRNSNNANQSAFSFVQTKDLDEAAGLLLEECAYLGRRSFGAFLSTFQTTGTPAKTTRALIATDASVELAIRKLEMFILGEYRGVMLRRDRQQKRIEPRWMPSKKNMFRIWTTYRDIMTEDDFARIFPDNKTQIETWRRIEESGHRIYPRGMTT